MTGLELARIQRKLEEFEPASARGERIGFDPEAMLLYAEDFATTTRTLLAEVQRLRASGPTASAPKPQTIFARTGAATDRGERCMHGERNTHGGDDE